MSEEKKKEEIKKYYLNPVAIDDCFECFPAPHSSKQTVALVEASVYNLTAGKLKVAEYELKKLAALLDKKNKEIDEMSDASKTVSESAYLEVSGKYKACVNKLKKMGSYSGE